MTKLTLTLTQAKAAFQKADHNLQLAWGNGDPAGIRAAVAARTKAYKVVAKMVKTQMAFAPTHPLAK